MSSEPAVPNERWVFLTSKEGDLREKEATRLIFEKYKPTYVIHLAARVGGLNGVRFIVKVHVDVFT